MGQLRQRHLDDAQALQPQAAQQRLNRRGFARALVAVKQNVARLPPVQQPTRVFHQHAALLFIEHHVFQSNRVRLADAAQAERIFFVLAHPRAAGAAGKQPRSLLLEKRRHKRHALAAQHRFGQTRIAERAAQRRFPDRQTRRRLPAHPRALA